MGGAIRDRTRGAVKRLRALLRRDAVDRELADELAFHLDQETAANIGRGMSPTAARRAAVAAFGGVDRFSEGVRDVRSFGWLESLLQDVRQATRGYRRSPLLALLVVLTLGLGIGGATAIFGVVNAVVLRPLPFPAADRLVQIWETTPQGDDFSVSEPNFLDLATQNRTFDGVGAYRLDGVVITAGERAERVRGLAASHQLFDLLGARPALGRMYVAGEDRPGGERVALLSDGLWRRLFGGDPDVLGRSLRFDGESFTIIGVLEPDVNFLGAELWRPLAADPHADRSDHWLRLIGRLGAGVGADEAHADLAAIAVRFGDVDPAVAGWGVRLQPLADAVVDERFREAGLLLLAAVGLLLLMACANVTNLLLARATTRRTDVGIRLALGISRARLTRQLITETAMLAFAGAVLGVWAAHAALGALRAARPDFVPRIDEVGVDGGVLLFAAAITAVTTLLVGLLPALQSARTDVQEALKQSGRGGLSRAQHRLRETLVVTQVALAAVLLVGGGLMLRSVLRLQHVDPGFQTEHVWSVPLQLHGPDYEMSWQVARFYNMVTERLAAVPGVLAAGATAVDPFGGLNLVNDVTPEERAAEVLSSGYMQAAWRIVTPGYFDAAGVPLLGGRVFDDGDVYETSRVAVISRSLAQRLWPGEDAIGRRLFWGSTAGAPITVIGVVGDIRDVTLDTDPPPSIFLSSRQLAWSSMAVLVRTDGVVPRIGDAIRAAIAEVDPAIAVPIVRPLVEGRDNAIARPRLQAALLAAFALIALILAAVGLYGVLAFAVAQRTREIGIRMALGAHASSVLADTVRRGLGLTAAGVASGLLLAAALTRYLASVLYDTAPLDPVTFVLVAAVFMACALAATLVPAVRAARVPPAVALRSE